MDRKALFRLAFFSILVTLVALCTQPLFAQSQGAAAANAAAYDLFVSGNYQGAAEAYEKLLKDYPTDGLVPAAQIQLAYTYFFLADYAKAEQALAKATSGPPLSPALAETAAGFLPQILSAKALAIQPKDPARKAAYQAAIQKFSDFLTKFPNSSDAESATFGRAFAAFQIADYDAAIADLESNLKAFPSSGSIIDSQNMLALALAAKGSTELMKGDSADKPKAIDLYNRAAGYLRDIIAKKTDLALVNDANFQLGEILFNQAQYCPEAERPALYAQALQAYRNVIPKEETIALQEAKLATFPDKRKQAFRSNNPELRKQLEKDFARQTRKLDELKARQDQVATALLKAAEIYYFGKNYNEARTLITHVTPFLETDNDKKRALYFATMTYALQNLADKASAGYQQYQDAYKADAAKGDLLAANLPVTLGSLYLSHPDPAVRSPQKAIEYFKDSVTLYPKGPYVGLSVVNQAMAQSQIGQADSALQTFKDYLAKNPPPDIAVQAQIGLAGIYKDTGKWDDAIAAYKTVLEKYPTQPQTADASFWLAFCSQRKGDNTTAIDLFQNFVKQHGDSPYTPSALYSLASAYIATQQNDKAIATLEDLAAKYADSPAAPLAYLVRAQLYGAAGQADKVSEMMKAFIEKYPQNENISMAYETLAGLAVTANNPDEAVGIYSEFVEKNPAHAKAATMLYKAAALQRQKAESLGRYTALNPEEKELWAKRVNSSVALTEQMLAQYPESPDLSLGLRELLLDQRLLVSAGLKQEADIAPYLQGLADKAAASKAAQSKVLFILASYLLEQDRAKALAMMEGAYDPAVVFSPADFDLFGTELIAQKKFDLAAQVFANLAQKYPNPPGIQPDKAQPQIQEAQADALFGMGRIAQEKGDTAGAGKYFEQLKATYPWSPKVLEANYGIAQSLLAQGKPDEAIPLLTGIIRSQTATSDLRANAMLLNSDCLLKKMAAAPDDKTRNEYRDAAIDNFIKVAQFYSGVPIPAARGLWEGARLLEEQSGAAADPKFKAQQLNRAISCYKDIVKDFPNSEFAPKAKERLAVLAPTK